MKSNFNFYASYQEVKFKLKAENCLNNGQKRSVKNDNN